MPVVPMRVSSERLLELSGWCDSCLFPAPVYRVVGMHSGVGQHPPGVVDLGQLAVCPRCHAATRHTPEETTL